jgi:rhodanese-related sulfurtransferase
VSARELAARLTDGAPVVLIDVREPWEHELVALPGSILIPLGELETRGGEIAPPAGALVVAYCHHGVRSLSAAAILEQLGLRQVASLAGGIDGWALEVDSAMARY